MNDENREKIEELARLFKTKLNYTMPHCLEFSKIAIEWNTLFKQGLMLLDEIEVQKELLNIYHKYIVTEKMAKRICSKFGTKPSQELVPLDRDRIIKILRAWTINMDGYKHNGGLMIGEDDFLHVADELIAKFGAKQELVDLNQDNLEEWLMTALVEHESEGDFNVTGFAKALRDRFGTKPSPEIPSLQEIYHMILEKYNYPKDLAKDIHDKLKGAK